MEATYLHKFEKNPYSEVFWNIPEQKQGRISVVGGNAQMFRTTAKIAEYLETNFPLERVSLVLPDALKDKLPPLENLVWLKSTSTGSFANEEELVKIFNFSDASILPGELSKNTATAQAVVSACVSSEKPLFITRDAVDLIAMDGADKLFENERLTVVCSMVQLQKLLRSAYYPKVVLLSSSLIQVAEILHKLTLSYPLAVVTLHNDMVLIAKDGEVNAMPLEKTPYTAMNIWNGELTSRMAALSLYHPNFLEALVAGVF